MRVRSVPLDDGWGLRAAAYRSFGRCFPDSDRTGRAVQSFGSDLGGRLSASLLATARGRIGGSQREHSERRPQDST